VKVTAYTYGPAFGTNALRLRGNYVSPGFIQIYKMLSGFMVFLLGCWTLMAWLQSDGYRDTFYYFVGGIAVFLIIMHMQIPLQIGCMFLGPRLDVVVAPDWVKVGGPLWYKTYHGNSYGFAVEDHEDLPRIGEILRETQASGVHKKASRLRLTSQLVMYMEDMRIVLAELYDSRQIGNGMATRLNLMKQEVIDKDLTG
jgi:hypothetical protein